MVQRSRQRAWGGVAHAVRKASLWRADGDTRPAVQADVLLPLSFGIAERSNEGQQAIFTHRKKATAPPDDGEEETSMRADQASPLTFCLFSDEGYDVVRQAAVSIFKRQLGGGKEEAKSFEREPCLRDALRLM